MFKDLIDAEGIVEAVYLAVKTIMEDSLSLSEALSKIAVQLNLTESQLFSEELIKTITLGKTDVLDIAEVTVKAVVANKVDSQVIAESKDWFFNKIISDAIMISASTIEWDVTQEVWWGMIKWRTACHGGL